MGSWIPIPPWCGLYCTGLQNHRVHSAVSHIGASVKPMIIDCECLLRSRFFGTAHRFNNVKGSKSRALADPHGRIRARLWFVGSVTVCFLFWYLPQAVDPFKNLPNYVRRETMYPILTHRFTFVARFLGRIICSPTLLSIIVYFMPRFTCREFLKKIIPSREWI